jgi:multidrug efflux system membrane fusion protein
MKATHLGNGGENAGQNNSGRQDRDNHAIDSPFQDRGREAEVIPPPSLHGPKRPRRWLLVVIGVILIVGAAVHYSHRPAAEKRVGTAAPLAISTATVKTGDLDVYVKALGSVTPLNTVSLSARVAGQIVKVNYQEGQFVHAGDPLVEIDPAPYQAAVTQAEGQLSRDQALLENARVNLDRYSSLVKAGAIAKQQYDTQVATVHQYEGTVELDQGNLASAKVNLAYCRITSPIDGRVGLRLVDPGNIVPANGTNPLVVITQLQPISVVFNLAEDSVPRVVKASHDRGKLTADAYDRSDVKQIAIGTLETLDNQIQTASGTLRLRANFDNNDQSLFPNQFVNVRLLVATHKGVALLPNAVIQRNDNGAFVYFLQPDKTVSLKPITTATTDGQVTEVKGLALGAVVAADNFNRLTDGAKVAIRPDAGEGTRADASGK